MQQTQVYQRRPAQPEAPRARSMNSYVAVTPARDEEALLPQLIAAMVGQTCRASRWVVVDDGSEDRTGDIIDQAAREHPWIEPHHLPRGRERAPGGESVIMRFLTPEKWRKYDAVLRLDADLSFNPDFTESLLEEFRKDARLGIGGPTLREQLKGRWRDVMAPRFHCRGAAKMYSRECFEAIGGLEDGIGWDTIDEVRALSLGFGTQSFRHIFANHHRPQGAASGLWNSRKAAGRAAYRIGYSSLFLAARAIRISLGWPPAIGGAALVAGFVEGSLKGDHRPITPAQIKFVRNQQHRRLLGKKSLWR